jgi:hypothetical protein
VKTTTTAAPFRPTANPRRTPLVHVKEAGVPQAPAAAEHTTELPAQTANPRRTVLVDLPVRTPVAD